MSTTPYWLAILGYSVLMLVVGCLRWVRPKDDPEHATLEFWMARRQLPGWMLAVSITSGWLMLGWIGFGMSQVYMYGATALWILNIPWFLLCLIVIVAVPWFRRVAAVSVPQALGKRFGPGARVLAAVFSVFVFIAWTQAELYMGGHLISPFLGQPKWVCLVVLVAPVLVYMTMGGFRVVIITDQIQFALMAVFMIVLAGAAVMAASHTSGGQVMQTLQNVTPPSSAKGHVFDLWFLGFLFPLVLLVGYLPGWLLEQDLALRMQAAPSTREAYKGAIYGWILISIFVLALPTVVAACAMVVFPPVNGTPPDAIGSDALGITSAFIKGMPAALSLFMVVGIVACQMSTVDTFANVSALALAYDLLDPMLRKRQVPQAQRVVMSRIITVVVLLASLGCAMISDSLKDVYYISSGVLSASVAIPAIFIYWRRTTTPAVLAASIAGFLGTVGGYFYEFKYLQAADANAPHHYMQAWPVWLHGCYGYLYVAAGVVLSLVVIVVVSVLTPKPSPRQLAEVKERPVDDFVQFAAEATGEQQEESVHAGR